VGEREDGGRGKGKTMAQRSTTNLEPVRAGGDRERFSYVFTEEEKVHDLPRGGLLRGVSSSGEEPTLPPKLSKKKWRRGKDHYCRAVGEKRDPTQFKKGGMPRLEPPRQNPPVKKKKKGRGEVGLSSPSGETGFCTTGKKRKRAGRNTYPSGHQHHNSHPSNPLQRR